MQNPTYDKKVDDKKSAETLKKEAASKRAALEPDTKKSYRKPQQK
ncbi:hypothetical protein [Pseudoalteromonas rhizosphaerae]|nr:hypothetical protein [Pseudoalteromonas rhizosphaerae]